MFPVCNLLTRAESPAGCLWQAGSPQFSYVELTLNKKKNTRRKFRFQIELVLEFL
ncbi:hypothetical protein [Leptospira noguchii]|uniref:hypothetical protein n=1 Tax=Leptospira noguchii TaxID=28182 RepID=UPI001FB62DDE|nr:hypothetical protein [Leptospira noguchii]UOG52354.1 hypothetical protein MAL09_17515 [Leptospira noguchii]